MRRFARWCQQDIVRSREERVCEYDQANPVSPTIGLHILLFFSRDLCATRLMPSEICVVRPPRVRDGLENAMNVAVTCPLQLEGEQLKLDALENGELLNGN